jgi:hypothetical protein
MLLNETLKYPELELVVGLELNQVLTRNPFKYFHTQPHFDDPNIKWWFGDAPGVCVVAQRLLGLI